MQSRSLAQAKIHNLEKKIAFVEKIRGQLIDNLQRISSAFLDRRINRDEYNRLANEKKNGKTAGQWIEYYDWLIEEYKRQIRSAKERVKRDQILRVASYLVPILILVLAGVLYFSQEPTYLAPSSKTYTDSMNKVFEESTEFIWNVGNPGELESLKISGSLEGEGNVKIYLENRLILDSSNLEEIQLSPLGNESSSTNVTIIEGNTTNITEENITIPDNNETDIAEENVTAIRKDFSNYCKETCDLSGFGLDKESYILRIEIEGNAVLYLDSLTYAIVGPTPPGFEKKETKTERGKRIEVAVPEGMENSPLKVGISKEWKIREIESLKIYWVESDEFIEFEARDIDGDGLIDELEWLVTDNGEQTYEIIVITDANHLDRDRNFLSDIFLEVFELDDIWSEVISNGEYVRVTFERNLTNERDITVFPRKVNGNPRIEVYEINGDVVIAEFSDLIDNEYNTVFLTNLEGEQDTFDLRVVGGSLEFDHVVDPVLDNAPSSCTGDWADCINANVDDSNTASLTGSATGRLGDWSGFVFSIPIGSTINSVRVRTKYHGSHKSNDIVLRAWDNTGGSYLVGHNLAGQTSACTEVITDIAGDKVWTVDDLNNIQLQYENAGGGGRPPDRTWEICYISIEVDYTPNQAPVVTITSVDDNLVAQDSIVDLQAGTTQAVRIIFDVEDPDGPSSSNLNEATLAITYGFPSGLPFTEQRNLVDVSTDCTSVDVVNVRTYNCDIDMQYFDAAGTWDAVVSIDDTAGAAGSSTQTFDVNLLQDITVTTPIGFGTVTPGTQVIASPLTTVTNLGNYEGTIKVTAYDLTGPTTISTTSFRAAGVSGAATVCSDGTILDHAGVPPIEILSTNLLRDTFFGEGQSEDISWCLDVPPSLPAGAYTATGVDAWTISLALAAFAIRRRKKKKKPAKGDKLVQAIGLIIAELREKYSLNKEETLGILIKELGKKCNLNRKDINELLDLKQEEGIPTSIFTKKLGGLEALCKYMKENLGMSYREMGVQLNRNERTVWTAYNKAKKKKEEPLEIKEDGIVVPLEIFKNRKLTVLESLVVYFRERKMKYREIGDLLERNPRNLQTIHSRAIKK